MKNSRRSFLKRSSILGAAGLLLGTRNVSMGQDQVTPQAPAKTDDRTLTSFVGPLVQTPDVPKLQWTIENGVKVFRLTAEVIKTQFIPGKNVNVWGFNGSMPGPTIEVHEGDTVRIIVQNKLPEALTMHWHGLEVPLQMDGVPFISQPLIEPGQTFTYEYTVHQNGTFFYHTHMAMQEMLGLIGLYIIHPKQPYSPRVDKDYGLILQEWALLPNNPTPNTLSMEFNWLTINGKAGPATTPLLVKQGERIRIRMVNLGMDHHPMHIHGNQFYVTGTEGGRTPESAWFPGNTVLVGVAQARDIEFDAIYAGDWMLHCHLPHHMMNQMTSMVGPMMHASRGSQTGKGMEEGMGIVRQDNALSEDLAPGMGRGMGMTRQEQPTSNLVAQQQNMPGMNMGQQDEAAKRRVPGYPQDMVMFMDKEVAKPETYGLPPGWTGSVMGMMTLVRVLPAAMYEEVMRRVRAGIVEAPSSQPPMKHIHE